MDTLQEVKDKTPIVDLAGRYASLKRAGATYKANCPFHAEKTPSFVVDPQRGTWRCYGACNVGGDVFSLVMRVEKVDFKEALSRLAREAGVELRRADPNKTRRESSEADRIIAMNRTASEWFQQMLHSPAGDEARRYLISRGITDDIAKRHGVGLASVGMVTLRDHLRGKGFTEEQIVEARLASRSESGGVSDFFKNRITFEIRDIKGRVIGFGARGLGDEKPKYINTPRTVLFNKMELLYGIDRAAHSISKVGSAVIVEGYTDVISAHEHNFSDVVATMGVALSGEHIQKLKTLFGRQRLATITLCLDADQAGQDATVSALERVFTAASEQRINLRVAQMSTGKDPDELIRNAPGEWQQVISKATHALEFMANYCQRVYATDTSAGRAELIKRVLPLVGMVWDNYERDKIVRFIANQLEVDERGLLGMMPKRESSPRYFSNARRKNGRSNAHSPLRESAKNMQVSTASARGKRYAYHIEDHLLRLLFSKDFVRDVGKSVDPDLFTDPLNRQLFVLWCADEDFAESVSQTDGELAQHLDEVLKLELLPADDQSDLRNLNLYVNRLKVRQNKKRIEALSAQLPDSTGDQSTNSTFVESADELHKLYEAQLRRS